MLSGDKPSNTEQRNEVQEAMYRPEDTLEQVRTFYETVTEDLIRKNKKKLGNSYQIDIVKEYALSPRTHPYPKTDHLQHRQPCTCHFHSQILRHPSQWIPRQQR